MDPLERVIRPIVEGQVRSFANDHPEVVDAVNWYKPRKDKKLTFVNSVSKRIVRNLLCPTTRVRLAAALVELGSLRGSGNAELELALGPQGDGVAYDLPRPLPTEEV